ncbi:hypothetical protein OSB04_003452 [Centaurea solstitialis]|uniref:Uncharacterized protein n=1 Tax=Centaurea solstitialis TaxID=347529 RepID=A0AA38WVQ2_9ASTR|nr:hypothetical protein OSB04_003452 [Centaurea solstitialis]
MEKEKKMTGIPHGIGIHMASHVASHMATRNKSLTKEEIAIFWRLKKMEEEELFFLKASSRLSKEDKKVVYDGSDPHPPSLIAEEEGMEPLLKKHGWWISSSWAFLNEPPNISSKASYNYVAQFHVAQKHINNFNVHLDTYAITA